MADLTAVSQTCLKAVHKFEFGFELFLGDI